MSTETEKKVWTYTVHIYGIWGRNRKAKHGSFEVIRDSPFQYSKDDAERAAIGFIRKLKPKTNIKAQLAEIPMTIEQDGPLTIRSFAFGMLKTLAKWEQLA